MAPLTLGGPRITPLHRVKVMSSSSSRPQLTVPSPTPFWPSSSSSSSRKLRGTLTPVCGQTHSKPVMLTDSHFQHDASRCHKMTFSGAKWKGVVSVSHLSFAQMQQDVMRGSFVEQHCKLLMSGVARVLWLWRCCIIWPLQWDTPVLRS